jgi:hypothetical protein
LPYSKPSCARLNLVRRNGSGKVCFASGRRHTGVSLRFHRSFGSHAVWRQWAILGILSGLFALALEAIRLPAGPAAVTWFSPISWVPFAETLALIGFGTLSARLRRIPAAPLLLPLGLGIALQDAGVITIELPLWLLAASYAIVGWSTGLGFNRTIPAPPGRCPRRHDPRSDGSLRRTYGSPCVVAGIDPLTAYLGDRRAGPTGSDHRDGEQGRCGIRDGDADHPLSLCC